MKNIQLKLDRDILRKLNGKMYLYLIYIHYSTTFNGVSRGINCKSFIYILSLVFGNVLADNTPGLGCQEHPHLGGSHLQGGGFRVREGRGYFEDLRAEKRGKTAHQVSTPPPLPDPDVFSLRYVSVLEDDVDK